MSKRSIEDMLHESRQLVKQTKRKVCRKCKETAILVQSNFCESCYQKIREEKEERLKNNRITDAKGYIRIYNSDMKLVMEHRHVMEKYLGRPLTNKEVVLHRDGDRSNNDLSNLILSLKGGTPFEFLKCESCGTLGNITVELP